MFPKPLRRAFLSLFLVLFFYSLFTFLENDVVDNQVIHRRFATSKTLLSVVGWLGGLNPGENIPGCYGDCLRLQELWNTWPKDKPKAVIYYLIQARRLYEIKKSLESIDAFFNYKFKYPIVIFHETDIIPLKNMYVHVWHPENPGFFTRLRNAYQYE